MAVRLSNELVFLLEFDWLAGVAGWLVCEMHAYCKCVRVRVC